ncbi:MAG: DUF393 domain-containing protein [Pedosphaera sp.]|nr:DUF393 domain-containing protein [Pedosphaera sp.]
MPCVYKHTVSHRHPVIVFDGVCNLCNGWVRFVVRRDSRKIFRFATLQSEAGRQLSKRCGFNSSGLFTSMLLFDDERHFTKSDAALRVLHRLGGIWRMLSLLLVIPRSLRDPVYDFIARNRYRLFGRSDACLIPTGSLLERFLR